MRDFPPKGPDGPCWTQAALDAGSCAQVLQDQSALALAFTNCHLAQSGRPPAPLPPHMSDATFAIYTEFFTHTADLCFHLQGEHYHQRAHDAIDTLTDRARDYATLLRYLHALAGVVHRERHQQPLVQSSDRSILPLDWSNLLLSALDESLEK